MMAIVDYDFEFYTKQKIDRRSVENVIETIKQFGGKVLYVSVGTNQVSLDKVLEDLPKEFYINCIVSFINAKDTSVLFGFKKGKSYNIFSIFVDSQIPFDPRIDDKEQTFENANSVKNQLEFIKIIKEIYYLIKPELGLGDTPYYFEGISPIGWIDKLEFKKVPCHIFFGPKYVKKYKLDKLNKRIYWRYEKLKDGGLMLLCAHTLHGWDPGKLALIIKELSNIFNLNEEDFMIRP